MGLVGAVEPATPFEPLVGLEHEYQLSRDGRPVDFRSLIHGLPVPGRRLDPGDANAYRCPSGMAVTCDDAEAEIASPPLALAPGFAAEVDGWAGAGHALLDDLLPGDVALTGFSTHLSAAVADADADRVLARLATTFAPALMMVLDRADSHGIYLRPRPSRMELCGEYAVGPRLRAATALFAGAVRACAGTGPLPPPLAVTALPASGRVGLELDRHRAFGFDLYGHGRSAALPARGGGTVGGQLHLEQAWGCARAALAGVAGPADLVPMDRIVRGASPLGVETSEDDPSTGGRVVATAFGDLLLPRRRGGIEVAPAVATWSFTVFVVRGAGRTRYACVPRAALRRFLAMLDAGELDGALATAPSAGRTLARVEQTARPGLWDEMGEPAGLLPRERGATAGAGKAARRGKAPVPPAAGVPRPAPAPTAPPSPSPISPGRAPFLAGLAVVAVLIAAALASGLLGGHGRQAVETVAEAPTVAVATTGAPTTEAPVPTSAVPVAASTSTSAPAPATTPATAAPPTVAATRPATTQPAPSTTVAEATTTTVAPDTTTAAPGPVTVTIGPGCAFSPTSLSRPVGTALRFSNRSGADVTVTVTGPPGTNEATVSLDAGGTSGTYTLAAAGTYAVRCQAGAAAGQMAVTAA